MHNTVVPTTWPHNSEQWRIQDLHKGVATARPERLRAGVWFLGRGNLPPPHQLGGLGSAVSSPSGVRGRAPAAIVFLHFTVAR